MQVPSSNKKSRQRQDIAKIIGVLDDRFPLAFMRQRCRRVPLKIGICSDIATALSVEEKTLSAALFRYANGLAYLHRLKVGAPRIDLDGNECGNVTEDEAKSARRRIADKYKQRRKRLRKLEKEQEKQRKAQAKLTKPQPPQRLGLAGLKEAARLRKAQNELQV